MGYGDYCDYDEYQTFYRESFPRARKEHTCCECGGKIKVGEGHLYAVAGGSDGGFCTDRQHMVCRELCMVLNGRIMLQGSPGTEGCFAFGLLRDEWRENDGVEKDGSEYSKTARRLMAQINWRLRREGQKKKCIRLFS